MTRIIRAREALFSARPGGTALTDDQLPDRVAALIREAEQLRAESERVRRNAAASGYWVRLATEGHASQLNETFSQGVQRSKDRSGPS